MNYAKTFTLTQNKSELDIMNELGRGKSYLARGGWLIVTNSTYLFIVFSNKESYKKAVEDSDLTEKEKMFLFKFLRFLIRARMHQGQFNFSPDSYLELFNNGLSLSIEGIDLVINKRYTAGQSKIAVGLELINDILKGVAKDLTNNFMEHVKNPSKFLKGLNAIKFLDAISDMLIFLRPDLQSENDIIKVSMNEALELYDGYFNLNKMAMPG